MKTEQINKSIFSRIFFGEKNLTKEEVKTYLDEQTKKLKTELYFLINERKVNYDLNNYLLAEIIMKIDLMFKIIERNKNNDK